MCIRDRYQRRVREPSQLTMPTGNFDLKRHGPNAHRHNGSTPGNLSGKVLGKIDEIRRGLAGFDPRCTGLVSEKDFKKVLYLEAGIDLAQINLILEQAPCKGGFVGYDTWLVDYLNMAEPQLDHTNLGPRSATESSAGSWQTGLSALRSQGQAQAHPGQPWEETQRVVMESANHLLSSFTLVDTMQTGFISVADLRGALYLKVGLKPEQVDMILNGITEGDVHYADWLTFFTTHPSPTVADLSQFIRHGGASTTGNAVGIPEESGMTTSQMTSSLLSHPDLGNMNPQYLVNKEARMVLPDLLGAPGIPYDDCLAAVHDIHVTETQDIREKQRMQDARIQDILREEALRQKRIMTVESEGGVQYTKAL
eukprot:TRINITY_DN330_c0_g1_i5.p1 TRINITY_DN330_c0_g1~~TRINITY_DN330_c0_g1_i5.p1  ORF type:complete len:367 (-),score=101.27 TRINITY_DN330_c0_g1_i5:345-1445(-)